MGNAPVQLFLSLFLFPPSSAPYKLVIILRSLFPYRWRLVGQGQEFCVRWRGGKSLIRPISRNCKNEDFRSASMMSRIGVWRDSYPFPAIPTVFSGFKSIVVWKTVVT